MVGAIQAAVRACDLVVAMAVGIISDGCNTRFGRRRPFILGGAACLVVGLQLYGNPPTGGVEESNNDSFCEHLQENCSLVRDCISERLAQQKANDRSGQRVSAQLSDGQSGKGSGGVLWLFISYAVFSMLGVTVTTIPYDALGQELADSSAVRSRLFAAKGFLYFAGTLFAVMNMVIQATTNPSSLTLQLHLLVNSVTFWVVVCVITLLLLVTERSRNETRAAGSTNIAVLLQQVLSNRPFWEYIFVKILVSVALHLYMEVSQYYVKYVVHTENSVQRTGLLNLLAVSFIPLYMNLTTRLLERNSARKLWRSALATFAVTHSLFACLPQTMATKVIFIVPFYYPILTATLTLVPNHLLAATLDYAKLKSGEDQQAMYITFDVNTNQVLDILVGACPALFLGALGFRNNGGCSCGCGIGCPSVHLRWSCPGDPGYACSSALRADNVPFVGVPSREPPCLLQPVAVMAGIRALIFHLPIVCVVLAVLMLSTMVMSEERVEDVKHQLVLRLRGEACYDPIRNVVILHGNSKEGKDMEHGNTNKQMLGEEASLLDSSPTRVMEGLRKWLERARAVKRGQI